MKKLFLLIPIIVVLIVVLMFITNTKDKYVYFSKDDIAKEDLTDKENTRPNNVNTYIKYKVVKSKLQEPQACIYTNDEELCLYFNKYEESKESILKYFMYDKKTWTEDNNVWKKDNIECKIKDYMVSCTNNLVSVSINDYGVVRTDDKEKGFSCFLYDLDNSCVYN